MKVEKFIKKDGASSLHMDQIILLPIKHVRTVVIPANKIFFAVIDFINHWMQVPEDKRTMIKEIIQDLNTYSAIDDLMDFTTLRQGVPTAHEIFGIANTINGFNFQLSSTMENVLKLDHPKAMGIFCDTWKGTLAGQGLEIYWRDSVNCPTEEEYNTMATIKTGSWLCMLAKLLQLFSTTMIDNEDLEKLIKQYALYAQIIDDYNCLTSPKYFASKGFCDDITEGKFTFPIVHAINTHPEEKQNIIDILKKKTKDVELKKQCLAILEKCGSFDYTLKKLEKLKRVILDEIMKLGGNPCMLYCFERLSETN